MKFNSSLFMFLVAYLASLWNTNQVNGTRFSCGRDQEGYFRIVSDKGDDTSQQSGQVQICYDPDGSPSRSWYNVCGDNNWNDSTAATVCQHLGFSETGALAMSGDFIPNVAFVECSEFKRTSSTCGVQETCTQQASVRCKPSQCRDGELRLRDGSTAAEREGRVEICFNRQWGTIELSEWGVDDANVACGQLGFSNEGARTLDHGFGSGTGPIHFADFDCLGLGMKLLIFIAGFEFETPERLLNCEHDTSDRKDHNSDVRVSCMATSCMDGEVRLVNGTQFLQGRPLNGRVEVCMNGGWGSVCDDHWDTVDAGVVCSQLGFRRKGAIAVQQSAFGEPVIDPILLDDVQCDETNVNLFDCNFQMSRERATCSHREIAGVLCEVCFDGEIRLMNGSHDGEGRVEICVNQQWSSVCDHSWSEADAIVTCRQLGYTGTLSIATNVSLANFGRGEGTIYFSDFKCTGMESSLLSCDVSNTRACDHSMDVGVMCFSEQAATTTVTSTIGTTPGDLMEPAAITEARGQNKQSVSLVIVVAVLGVISGVLMVALVAVIIACIILVNRKNSVKTNSDKPESTEAMTYEQHELDNPVYGGNYDEIPKTLHPTIDYEYVQTRI